MEKSITEFFEKLREFLKSDTRNLWINTNDFKIYVRKSKRPYNNKLISCLDLATIEVFEPGKGLFTVLLNVLLRMKMHNIFIESIINERFYKFLALLGFEECGPTNLIKVFKEDYCEHSPFGDGSCCCNCEFRIELYKHPWNKNKLFKGSIMDSTGIYVCSVTMDKESQHRGIVSEWKHSACELHTWRGKVLHSWKDNEIKN